MKTYGVLESEKIAELNLMARNIVKELNDFGINDHQRQMIIYLLALELEDRQTMLDVTTIIREQNDHLLVTDLGEKSNG